MHPPVVDIGILTIRDDEFKAVLREFSADTSVYKARHRDYALRTADSGDTRRYSVAILRQIEQGNGEAQEAARDMIDDLQPSLLLVVGIAGGLPSDDVTLGDVVISTRVVDFSVEARKFQAETTYNVGGGPIARTVAAGVANLSARGDALGSWWNELPPKPKVSWSNHSAFYGPASWKKLVKEKIKAHFVSDARPPAFCAGAIASSDRLVKDPKLLFPWITTARSLLAIEMESAGAHRATRERVPMLAIRGLSDIVGFRRSEAWTKYACGSAAAFTKAYLRTTPVPPKTAIDVQAAAATATSTESGAQPSPEEAFSNLLPLRYFPEKIYIGPALCQSNKHGWQLLRGDKAGTKDIEYVPGAWLVYEKRVYTFANPENTPLGKIVDVADIEAHDSKEWAFSKDILRRRLFVSLLNNALRDDLWSFGVRYHSDADIYAFIGYPSEPPRRFKYPNVKVRSTLTVVGHHVSTSQAGKSYTTLRHNAFKGRFRYLGENWSLEITPTYRFTTDGRAPDRFHEERLSGIKRFERNRAVLSQILLWQALLRSPWKHADRKRLLEFAPLVNFSFVAEEGETQMVPVDDHARILEVHEREGEE
jgi:nucleoside phosphorylase